MLHIKPGELMTISVGMFPDVPSIVNDLGLVGVSISSITKSGRLKVGDPPLTVARRCLGSMRTGSVNWGDSEPLLNTSLSVSLPSVASLQQTKPENATYIMPYFPENANLGIFYCLFWPFLHIFCLFFHKETILVVSFFP